MFTGLVECMGTVREAHPRRGSTRLGIRSSLAREGAAEGDSVAVDGVCLTVARRAGEMLYADAVRETLSRTTLKDARVGWRVNLERSLRLGDRLGGHLVQGHVDTVARVTEVRRDGDDHRLQVALDRTIRHLVAEKGSVTLNGVSLTVSRLAGDTFEVVLIPETIARTNLGALRAGQSVNVEADLLARYLERLGEARREGTD
jgi:riboflavin synthase